MRPAGHGDARRLLGSDADHMAYVMNRLNRRGDGCIEVLHWPLANDVRRGHKPHLRKAVHGCGGTRQGRRQKANCDRRPLHRHDRRSEAKKGSNFLTKMIANSPLKIDKIINFSALF